MTKAIWTFPYEDDAPDEVEKQWYEAIKIMDADDDEPEEYYRYETSPFKHLPRVKRSRKFQDLTGMTFGLWYVVEINQEPDSQISYWCQCVCGVKKSVRAGRLRAGTSRQCGPCANRNRFNKKESS